MLSPRRTNYSRNIPILNNPSPARERADIDEGPFHDQEVLSDTLSVPYTRIGRGCRLCGLSYLCSLILQLYRLQHRDPASMDRNEKLFLVDPRADLLEIVKAFLHLPAGDTHIDCPFGHSCHCCQSETSWYSCLPRLVFYPSHQWQHCRRYCLAFNAGYKWDHQRCSSFSGHSQGAYAVAGGTCLDAPFFHGAGHLGWGWVLHDDLPGW